MLKIGDKVVRVIYLDLDLSDWKVGTVISRNGDYFHIHWLDGSVSEGPSASYKKMSKEEWVAFMLTKK